MKSILKAAMALCLLFMASFANAQIRDSSGNMQPTMHNTTAQQEYVTVNNGATMIFKDGKSSPLTSAYTCDNGSKVALDGTVTKTDGSTVKLAEGQKIFKDGHIKTGTKKMDKSDKKMDDPDKY